MSRRDLLHVLTALAELAGNAPGVPVAVADLDERLGRGRADLRTTLNLASLAAEGLVEQVDAASWSATPAGIARHGEDEDYANR
ncbi:hypothetical protein DSM104299_01329 [Baekduia alba]|uniref:hypothetical protein n=1 Tax=Baekduia alba TaxID=2997333 RepID=UPI002341B2EF|nr:hypothetical protein [Baekduia alba]WCB92632.1 hypothetical protein DSM104299_01329 [Baekduia alba]